MRRPESCALVAFAGSFAVLVGMIIMALMGFAVILGALIRGY